MTIKEITPEQQKAAAEKARQEQNKVLVYQLKSAAASKRMAKELAAQKREREALQTYEEFAAGDKAEVTKILPFRKEK